MKTLQGKTIWLIGASTGIGAALARQLDQQGAHLILSARSTDKLEKLNESLTQDHMVLSADFSTPEAIDDVWSIIKNKENLNIDSMIFLAAYYEPKALEEVDYASAKQHYDINVLSVFSLMDKLVPYFRNKGAGQIVLCGSVAGYVGLPKGQPYSSTKAAVMSIAQSAKAELWSQNIDVKLISPGFVDTPLTQKNKFKMPMIITADKAAEHISQGLTSRKFEIRFPFLFSLTMKIISILPAWLYFKIFRM